MIARDSNIQRIALTPGEPAGIGPDICIDVAQQTQRCQLVAVCDPELLSARARLLQKKISLTTFDPLAPPRCNVSGELFVLPEKMATTCEAGSLNVANAQYVLNTLASASKGCMDNLFSAIVTAPVQKSIINDAGISFSGHTEFFAEHSHTQKVVMMLATEGLRVALATTHLPLKDVSSAITQSSLTETLKILIHDLQLKFSISKPKILVCGLNPHAGEGGHLGMEEIETIVPVLDTFRQQGHNLVGPLPADTLFTPRLLSDADAVLAMYHDQGLPVLKHKGFGNAVNITLGLPYIRTSVDHGTALDLAGSGTAESSSLHAALNSALEMANNKTTTAL